MDAPHIDSPPSPPPSRFSIPAVVAGFTAPIMVWAISIAGLSSFPPVTDLLYVEFPFVNYDIDSLRKIDAAGNYDRNPPNQMVVRYSPLEQDTVSAAAASTPNIADRKWAYGGKRLRTQDVITAIKENHKAWGDGIMQPLELNCFNRDAFQVQGAIFEFYPGNREPIQVFNQYAPELDRQLDSYSVLTPLATQADFSACLAFRQQVEAELGPRE